MFAGQLVNFYLKKVIKNYVSIKLMCPVTIVPKMLLINPKKHHLLISCMVHTVWSSRKMSRVGASKKKLPQKNMLAELGLKRVNKRK